MRVLLDTSYALRGPSGTAVYLRALVPALREAGVDVVEAANARRRPPGTGSLRNLAEDVRWTNLELGRRAREHDVDLIHHGLPAHAWGADVPQVVTVHDLAFEERPQDFSRRYRLWARRSHATAVQRAQAVVAVSEATARGVVDRWGVHPQDLVIARHGPGQALPAVPERPRTHLLYVGDDEPRKDVDALTVELPLPVVLAGAARRPGLRSVERPDPFALAELYAGAAALVHPSRHEGFGLTVLEALALGVPVVAARSAAVAELVGDAGVLYDPGGLRAAVVEALARTDELRAAGSRRAARFSWARSAAAHVDAYRLALT